MAEAGTSTRTATVKIVGLENIRCAIDHAPGKRASFICDKVAEKLAKYIEPGSVRLFAVATDKQAAAQRAFIRDEKEATETFGATWSTPVATFPFPVRYYDL